jgi:hypothetical protein
MTQDTETTPFRIVTRRNGKCAIEYPCEGRECGAPAPRPGKWHTLVGGCLSLADAANFLRTAWIGVIFTTPTTGTIPPQGAA